MRKTKIVCSIGPASDNDETVREMILSGMNVARFNFSHGTYEWHSQAMERVRRISGELNIPVGIMLDTKGPEIRTGNTDGNKDLVISSGDVIEITGDDSPCTQGSGETPTHISLSWKEAGKKLRPGHKVLIADGLVELLVEKNDGEKVICRALNSGKFSSKKNVNLKGIHAGLPIMAEKDKEDLKFGASMDVDFVAASFVSFPEEVVQIKDFLKKAGANAKVIAKIENEEGLNNIEMIAREADGVMVARGDLGVQVAEERIPLAQKEIIRVCQKIGKPVITATQMLDSMIVNPRPTRAELTDVSNAVFDGTDAVMLSGETASGKYPVESIKTMALITSTTEDSAEYRERMKLLDSNYRPGPEIGHSVIHSAYKLARNIEAKAIIIPTLHGNTARTIGSYRPEQVIIAVTPDKKVLRQLTMQWGVAPVSCGIAEESETMIQNAVKNALDSGAVNAGDRVVMCAGIPLASPLMANTIKVLIVGNVIARGTEFGFSNPEKIRTGGRVIQANDSRAFKERMAYNRHGVLVCNRITEDLLPLLRVVDGVVAENGCDIPIDMLSMVNKDLVWILSAPGAMRSLENDLTVTLDGEQGLVYEGRV
ncbi:MAG: pyruvate kinase [Treponema sp.]|nr:pyruvate kinase [Treponema sp.]MBQ5384501.1 pyruvate kinase [Treponema sp.]